MIAKITIIVFLVFVTLVLYSCLVVASDYDDECEKWQNEEEEQ